MSAQMLSLFRPRLLRSNRQLARVLYGTLVALDG